jgi:hypothetical protein
MLVNYPIMTTVIPNLHDAGYSLPINVDIVNLRVDRFSEFKRKYILGSVRIFPVEILVPNKYHPLLPPQ